MLEHPWIELQLLIKEKWLTQKAFASILWKKVSEINELLKGKRNITIQRDYLLHQTLWTPIKYWIFKQIDYDYSLLDIEESDNASAWTKWKKLDDNKQNTKNSSLQTHQNIKNNTILSNAEEPKKLQKHSDSSPNKWTPEPHTKEKQIIKSKPQENQKKEVENKTKDDHKKRANIFKSF